jgi:hypothetical protein
MGVRVSWVFDAVFRDGLDVADVAVITDLAKKLGIAEVQSALGAAAVKQQLRSNADWAIAHGVFAVPTPGDRRGGFPGPRCLRHGAVLSGRRGGLSGSGRCAASKHCRWGWCVTVAATALSANRADRVGCEHRSDLLPPHDL